MDASTVGKKIQELREKRALSRTELANLAEVAYETVANVETARTMPRMATLRAIARALEVQPSELVA